MFTLIVGLYLGCYASVCYDNEIASVSFNFGKAWNHIVAVVSSLSWIFNAMFRRSADKVTIEESIKAD